MHFNHEKETLSLVPDTGMTLKEKNMYFSPTENYHFCCNSNLYTHSTSMWFSIILEVQKE